MKKLLTIILFLFCVKTSFAQTANAGADQTIYLTQTTSATLDGSASSGTSYLWSEVSTDYSSGGTITSTTSKSTTITGLTEQGVFYFQIAVTSGGATKYDTTVIRVDYDVAPASGNLFKGLNLSGIASYANNRSDTTDYIGYVFPNNWVDSTGTIWWMERARLPQMSVDSLRGKFYATVEDGYAWNGTTYDRSEMYCGNTYVDSSKTYTFEWKGYFPQPISLTSAQTATIIWQLHSDNNYPTSPPIQLMATNDSLEFVENFSQGNNGINATKPFPKNFIFYGLMPLSAFYNHTHTIRITVKTGEGYIGQTAFVKVEIDGIQKYSRTTGQVGMTFGGEYPKFCGIYDFNNVLVNPDSLSRGRKYSIITESFKIYTLSNNQPPAPISNTFILYGNYKFKNN